MLNSVDSYIKLFNRFLALISELILFTMMALIAADVIARYLFGKSILVAAELSGYFLVAIVCLSLANTQRTGDHIEITLVKRNLSLKLQKFLDLFTLLISIIFMAWLTYTTFNPVIYKFNQNAKSITFLATPMWIPYALVPIGFGALTIELVSEFLSNVFKTKK